MGNFSAKVDKFIEIFIDQNGYVKVVQGLQNTVLIAIVGLVIGILIGTVIATARVLPKYKVLPRVLNGICSVYVAMFRGTPMVVQLLVFYYVLLPIIGWNITGVQVAMLVFGLNSGAYISEIMRSGIQSVDAGQMEAGRAVGLSFGASMMKIVIPQAVKNILPTLGNEFIALIKETSLFFAFGGFDIMAYVVYHTVKGRSLPAGFEPALLVANFLLWMFMFGILFWCVTSLRAMFRMKKAYWTERTLTAKMLRKMKNKGEESGGKIQKKVKSIGRKIRNFFARQYDALLHLDFQDKTNRTILRVVLINFAILFVVCLFWWYGTVALIVYSVMLFMFLKKYTQDLSEKYALLLKSTNQLAEGHLDIPIEGDVGLFNPIQEELKRIQKGFKKAVDEEVKNERMKTELVTNVSHDLRTPLTAIITYTDLLKNEKDEEKRKEYISVLERKSLRLKVLIEDLFEISKAASKSVVMHFMKVDIVGLFKQVELENVEKIKAANLEFRTKIPEQKVVMWLDSEKTYRIFENLIVNITKYAMPHTRVYIDMTETEDGVHITMKNVSAAELNFNADEITDRFVRGDSARNTEGSGLGLAIAKSFAELQHGSLKISTEADLFKADLYLPKSKEMPEKPGGGYPENL